MCEHPEYKLVEAKAKLARMRRALPQEDHAQLDDEHGSRAPNTRVKKRMNAVEIQIAMSLIVDIIRIGTSFAFHGRG